jgi:hypothetical protein
MRGGSHGLAKIPLSVQMVCLTATGLTHARN